MQKKPEVGRTGGLEVVRGVIVVLRLRELLGTIQPRRVHLRIGADADIRQFTSGLYEKLDQRIHDNPAPRKIELRVARHTVLLYGRDGSECGCWFGPDASGNLRKATLIAYQDSSGPMRL